MMVSLSVQKWTWPYFISCLWHKFFICVAFNKFRINLADLKCLKGKSVKASSTAENRQQISWNNYVLGPTRKAFHCTVCSSLNTLFYDEQNLRFLKLARTSEKLGCLSFCLTRFRLWVKFLVHYRNVPGDLVVTNPSDLLINLWFSCSWSAVWQ